MQAWILEDLIRNMKKDKIKKSKNALNDKKNKEHGPKLRLLKIKKEKLRSDTPMSEV